MRLLISRPTDTGTEVIYGLSAAERQAFTEAGAPDAEHFTYTFARIAIGVGFDEGNFGVVVGERVWWGDRSAHSRAYLVLDEFVGETPADLAQWLIGVKDRYLAQTIYCPNKPQQLVETIKRTEGLTHYSHADPGVNRELFPSFVSTSTRAGLYEVAVPAGKVVEGDLETLLTTPVPDPVTSVNMRIGVGGSELMQLSLPDELNNRATRTAIRQGLTDQLVALWMGAMGLERTRPRRSRSKHKPLWVDQPRGNSVTGY